MERPEVGADRVTIASFRVAGKRSLEQVIARLRELPLDDGPVQIEVQRIEHVRDARSNAHMWVILNQISEQAWIPDGKGKVWLSPAAWKEFYRGRFIEPRDIRMANGKVVFDRPRTSELTQREFDAFLWKVRADAGERGVVLRGDNFMEA